jgi:hypothetical protein
MIGHRAVVPDSFLLPSIEPSWAFLSFQDRIIPCRVVPERLKFFQELLVLDSDFRVAFLSGSVHAPGHLRYTPFVEPESFLEFEECTEGFFERALRYNSMEARVYKCT